MLISVFCIAEMVKIDKNSSFMQVKSIKISTDTYVLNHTTRLVTIIRD